MHARAHKAAAPSGSHELVAGSPISRDAARVVSLLLAGLMMVSGLWLLAKPFRERADERELAARSGDEPEPMQPVASDVRAAAASGVSQAPPTASKAAAVAASGTTPVAVLDTKTDAKGETAGAQTPGETTSGDPEPGEATIATAEPATEPGEVTAAESESGGAKLTGGETPDELARRGSRARRAGHRSSARRLFTQALELEPNHGEALIGMSDLYFDSGSYSKALSYAQKAVRAVPRNADYRVRLGDAYFKLGRTKDARKHYTRAAKLGHPYAARRLDRLAGE